MNEEEYDKATNLEKILYDCTGMLVKDHSDIVEAMEKYAAEQLLISDISNQKELLIAFGEKTIKDSFKSDKPRTVEDSYEEFKSKCAAGNFN